LRYLEQFAIAVDTILPALILYPGIATTHPATAAAVQILQLATQLLQAPAF